MGALDITARTGAVQLSSDAVVAEELVTVAVILEEVKDWLYSCVPSFIEYDYGPNTKKNGKRLATPSRCSEGFSC